MMMRYVTDGFSGQPQGNVSLYFVDRLGNSIYKVGLPFLLVTTTFGTRRYYAIRRLAEL